MNPIKPGHETEKRSDKNLSFLFQKINEIITTCKISGLFSISVFAFFSLIFAAFSFSDEKVQSIIAKTNLFNMRFPQERVYLQLDRPSYWAGDDAWFKAYVKDSPINESNLYVEIINASGNVVNKNIAWVQNGLAYGDFQLADTLSSGVYQIRAYTNWMRNFDEVWFFRKDLVIWNPRDKKVENEPQKLRHRDIDLQFFPEGGTFVAGVKNRVAFKATDKNGKGIDFEGVITDESGNKVAEIKSNYKGIGSFVFQPQSGKKYTAEAVFAGNVEKKADLPNQENEGILLLVDALDTEKIKIQFVQKSLLNTSDEYTLFIQSGGNICHQVKITATGKINSIEFDKAKLPGGILKFTLFSSNLVPVCERLVFNDYVDVVNLLIKPDKPEYKPREKVKIGVAAIAGSGEPFIANLSMSVYNAAAQLKDDEFANNIFTHFLLSSELKGNIENPAWYFKDDSLTTLQALDNLMLTHGYREFEWKEILEDKQPEIVFQPEPSIEIKGRVISASTNRPVAGGKVTMMTLKSLLNVLQQETDSLGQFVFHELYFYDTIYVSLKAENSRGKTATIIEIDSSSSTSPESKYLPELTEYNTDKPFETVTYLSETQSDLMKRKWSLADTILIGDINVMARKKEQTTELSRPYLEADFVYDLAKQKSEPGNIYDAVEGKIPGVIYDHEKEIFYARGDVLKIYMDGIEVNSEIPIKDLSSQMFDKVEYVRSGIFAGINYRGGILFFYTKRGMKNFNRTPVKPLGMEGVRVIGYSITRKFFTPVYDTPEQMDKKEDFRSTIYWNPVVMTDSTGIAIEEFYQSDETGDMKIVVEGVTADGKLCRGVSAYHVKY
ncbi:MAG TPA: hypothetical protein DER09_01785 [Prolixibacteraceae bacterium]|nr:hypothetical protein [Prolixibacteraceae bacterium]